MEITIKNCDFDWSGFLSAIHEKYKNIVWLNVYSVPQEYGIVYSFEFIPLVSKESGYPIGIDLKKAISQQADETIDIFLFQVQELARSYTVYHLGQNNKWTSSINQIEEKNISTFKQNEDKKPYSNRTVFFDRVFYVILGLIVCILVIVTLKSTINQPVKARIEGNSMLPSFEDSEEVVVEKSKEIKRFDVVVFQYDDDEIYIKRVIGLPGEKLSYRDGILYINKIKVKDPFSVGRESFDIFDIIENECIFPNQYFVLGDNRENSFDSREFGLIDESQIIGIVRENGGN